MNEIGTNTGNYRIVKKTFLDKIWYEPQMEQKYSPHVTCWITMQRPMSFGGDIREVDWQTDTIEEAMEIVKNHKSIMCSIKEEVVYEERN